MNEWGRGRLIFLLKFFFVATVLTAGLYLQYFRKLCDVNVFRKLYRVRVGYVHT